MFRRELSRKNVKKVKFMHVMHNSDMIIQLLVLFHFLHILCGSEEIIYVYDIGYTLQLDPKSAYETVHLITAVQGLANRDSPQLYIIYTDVDKPWLDYLTSSGEWLQNASISTIPDLDSLLTQFSGSYNGSVVYDPDVHSTSSVASTSAGTEHLLPFCFGSDLYKKYVESSQIPMKRNLVGMFSGNITGSKKCDAYIWAIDEYINSGKCDPSVMGYFIDSFWSTVAKPQSDYSINTVTNQDYFIAKKGFFFDLDFWDDEAPNDDPTQAPGTDLHTVEKILEAAYKKLGNSKLIQIGGFTPWAFKYTDTKHGGVATEWQTVKILSSYNAYLDADACCVDGMANAGFYSHYPLSLRYVQNSPPQKVDLEKKGFISSTGQVVKKTYAMYYVGDYDSAAWLYRMLRMKWDDSDRGKGTFNGISYLLSFDNRWFSVALGWAVNPVLALRFPVIFPYMFQTRSPVDFFITGDSGAGYINPTQFVSPRDPSGFPDGRKLWESHCIPWYNKFNMKFTGFVINGASGSMTKEGEEMYVDYSMDGIVEQQGYSSGVHMRGNMPVFYEVDLPADVEQAKNRILSHYVDGKLQFQVYRTILQPASFHYNVANEVSSAQPNIEFVDPMTLSYLYRISAGGNNDNRVTYVSDSLPSNLMLKSKETIKFEVTVRNDGWNVISNARLNCTFSSGDGGCDMPVLNNIDPGTASTVQGQLTAPSRGGLCKFSYGLWYEEGNVPFSSLGNPNWSVNVQVQ